MLILVRHGRTAANAAGLLQGRIDPDLDDLGRRQAAAVAAAIDGVDRVVSSPLQRARSTAAAFGVPVEVDERWIELDYGDWDGNPITDVPATTWQTWQQTPSFAPPGGESLLEVGRRVRDACTELLEDAASRDVVVVSHVSPIKAAVAWALGQPDDLAWRLHLATASVSRILVRPNGVALERFNEVVALPDAP